MTTSDAASAPAPPEDSFSPRTRISQDFALLQWR